MTKTTPYIPHGPGDLITAEDWNEVQVLIKEDIASQVGEVETALEEFKEAPVDADTFGGKAPEEWKEDLDKRYAPLDHSHDGVRRYQRYFLELETKLSITLNDGTALTILQPAVIEHGMGRHPVIQVYELLDLPIATPRIRPPREYQLCF